MSEHKQDKEANGKKKSLLELKSTLEKKKSKAKYEKVAEDEDGSFSDEARAADEKELKNQLLSMPQDKTKAMKEKPSLLGNAKWYDKLFFNWAFKVIEVSITFFYLFAYIFEQF